MNRDRGGGGGGGGGGGLVGVIKASGQRPYIQALNMGLQSVEPCHSQL